MFSRTPWENHSNRNQPIQQQQHQHQHQPEWSDQPAHQGPGPVESRVMVDRAPYEDYLPKSEGDPERAQFATQPHLRSITNNQQAYHQQPQQPQPYNNNNFGQTHQHLVDYQNNKFNQPTYNQPTQDSHLQPYSNSNHTLPPVRTQGEYTNRLSNPTLDGRLGWRGSVAEEGVGKMMDRDSVVSQDQRQPPSAQYTQPIQHQHRFDSPHQPYYHSEPTTPALGHHAPGGGMYYYNQTQAAYSPATHQPPATYSPVQHHQHTYGYPSPISASIRPDTGSDYHPAVQAPSRTQSFANSPLAHQQSFAHHKQEHNSIYSYPGHHTTNNHPHGMPLASGSSSGSLTRPPTRANSIAEPSAPAPAPAPTHMPAPVASLPSLAYTTPINQHNRSNSPPLRQYLPAHVAQSALPPLSSVVSPLIPQPAIPYVRAASTARRAFRARPPPLTFNPAREPSASARLSKTLTSQGLVVPAQGAKGKAVLELVGSCWTCGEPSCKVILRGQDLSFAPRLSFTCLACVPEAGRSESPEEEGGKRAGSKRAKPTEPEAVYSDTLSAAVDVIEGADIRRVEEETPEATCSRLPEGLKPQGMKCDVCDRIVGCGTIAPADPHAGPAPPFTSEVICSRCTERYRACSDCGGGGGRLTPGRWRCKELFPQGRRTCQLSHARNPPLNEITYHVLPIVSLNEETRDDLKSSCRQLYFNTRLRVTARPEMLERGDGLCRTFAEAEKLTIDGWGLLQPLMEVDIEREKGIRRYVAVQYSIPHRRRAKSKTEPPPEEVTERTVSGFMLVEYEFATGAVYFAVVMPWALSGDAFDATTRLGDEVMVQCRADLGRMNEERARQGLQAFPALTWNWGITPFKKESRMTQSLTRRGFVFLDELVASGEMPEADLVMFPGYGPREIHVPKEFVKAFHIFARPLADGVAMVSTTQGSAPGAKRVRQRVRKRAL